MDKKFVTFLRKLKWIEQMGFAGLLNQYNRWCVLATKQWNLQAPTSKVQLVAEDMPDYLHLKSDFVLGVGRVTCDHTNILQVPMWSATLAMAVYINFE